MQDSIFTDPVAIRARYQSKGRNSKLNLAIAESLGAASSQISSTQAVAPISGGSGGTGISASSDFIPDPTLTNTPDLTYNQTRYKSFLFFGDDPESMNFL